jgi:FkbM family methyltransferase
MKHDYYWFGGDWKAQIILALVRHWPLPRGKSGLLRILTRWCFHGWLPLKHVHGARLQVDVTDLIGQALAQVGHFEPLSLALACQLMQGGGRFVDVGCNFGIYTCVVGSIPGVYTLAVDPSPRVLAQFERNLALNPTVECTRVYGALSNTAGFVGFDIPGHQNLGLGHVQEINPQSGGGSILVYAFPAVDMLRAVNCQSVTLLKIDIESGELAAMHGWDWTEKGRPKHILCEHLTTTDAKSHSMALWDFLHSKNYRPFRVDGLPWDSCTPLPEHNLWWHE